MAQPAAAVKASQKPVLYAVLLTAGAVVAIGVGGGLIRPMQDRWERLLTAAERETARHQADARRAAPPRPAPDYGGPQDTGGTRF